MGLFSDVFSGLFSPSYDPNSSAQDALKTANQEAMAPTAQGAAVQGVQNVNMGQGGEASQAAAENAGVAAGGARSTAEGAAQAAGLSGAAAANAGAGAGAGTYGNAYAAMQPQLAGLGVSERGQTLGANEATAANQTAASLANTQAGVTQRGQNLGYAQGMAGIGQQTAEAQDRAGGGFLSGIASLIPSDKNVKYDIHDDDYLLKSVADAIRGKSFKYKEGTPGAMGQEEHGIIAQDLEKTPLKSTVMDTTKGKMIDTGRLTTANTSMIADLSRKLDKALSYIGSVK